MRSSLLKIVIIGFALSITNTASSATNPMPSLIHYFKALAATTHGETTTADINAVLEFYSEDVVYEHPEFGIRLLGKQAQETGMKAFVDTYAGTIDDSEIEIVSYLKGPNMVAFNLTVSFLKLAESGVEEVVRNQTRILEIRDGKITRVIDYW